MTERLTLPQRFRSTAPIGSLLKRNAAPVRASDYRGDNDQAYLAMVRQCPCIKCGLDPSAEAAHVRISSAAFNKRGGIGKKPADRWTLPLDNGCHVRDQDALHRMGEYLFWQQLGINPLLIAEKLYGQKGDLVAMRAVIFTAIGERGK